MDDDIENGDDGWKELWITIGMRIEFWIPMSSE